MAELFFKTHEESLAHVGGIRARASLGGTARHLTVELIAAGAIDDGFRAEWQALDTALDVPNPYFAQWFLEPALTHLDPEGAVRLCVVRQGGLLVGLAPLVFQSGYAKLPLKHVAIWQHLHAYNGTPLIRRGFGVDVYRALFDWVDTRPGGARFFRFHQLPFDEVTQTQMAEACRLSGRHYKIQYRHERAAIGAGQQFDTIMKTAMSGKKRKELRRQANRFADLGEARFEELTPSAVTEAFLTLEAAGWKNTADGFAFARSEADAAFFREAMAAGGDAVRCLALTLDGKPTAMLFTLHSGDQLAAFKTTFDEDLGSYSPGFRLIMEATRRMLDDPGKRLFDSCARADHPVVDRLWPERLPIVQLNVPARHVADTGLLDLAAFMEGSKNFLLKRLGKQRQEQVEA